MYKSILNFSLIVFVALPFMTSGNGAGTYYKQSSVLPQQSATNQNSTARWSWNYNGQYQEGQLHINDVSIDAKQKSLAAAEAGRSETNAAGLSQAGVSSLSTVAIDEGSIKVRLSERSLAAGGRVIVSGEAPRDMRISRVRVLFQFPAFTRGLAEAPVGRDRTFSVAVSIPDDAPEGESEVLVVGSESSKTASGKAQVFIAQTPGKISGTVSLMLSDGTMQPVQDAHVFLTSIKFGGSDTTNSQGKYELTDVKPFKYLLDVSHPSIVFDGPKLIGLQPGQHLVVNFIGKFASSGIEKCETWKSLNPGKSPAMSAQYAKAGANFGPHIGTFASMPGKGAPFTNAFVTVLPFSVSASDKVRFRFRKSGTLIKEVDGVVIVAAFAAGVDMSEFPTGEIQVSVSVQFQTGGTASLCELPPGLSFTMIEVPWFNPWVTNRNIQVIKANPARYAFSGRVPQSDFSFDQPINLEFLTLDNIVSYGIDVQETLSLDGSWKGTAQANAQVTFLDIDFVNEILGYKPGSLSSYVNRPYAFSLPTVHKESPELCIPVPGLTYTLGEEVCFCLLGCCKFFGASLTTSICTEGFINLDSTIAKDLRPNLTVSPGVTISVPIELKVGAAVCNGDAKAEPSANVSFPIACDIVPNVNCEFQNPCIELSATLSYSVSCLGKTVFSGTKGLGQISFGCNTSSQMAALAESQLTTGDGVSEVAPASPSPSVATDGAGHALAVWVKEESSDPANPDRRLYYSFNNGETWSAAARLYDYQAPVEAPHVAFLGQNRAMAVWLQSKLSFDDLLASDEGTFFSNNELYYSIWDGRTWSAPTPITNDERFDGAPALAADPQTGRAMIVWPRLKELISEGQTPFGLFYAQFDGREWSAPAAVDPASTALDHGAVVEFDKNGQAVALWMRESDETVETSEDRQIIMTRFGDGGWAAPEPLPLPIGAYTPSLAFDADNNPIIVFVVAPRDPATGQQSSGDGNRSALYSAFRRGASWEITPVGDNTYAERPVVRVNADNHAITMYRQFGDKRDVHLTGDLAAAVADLNAPAPGWTTGFLTADGKVNWEVAYDVDRATSKNFVLNVKKISAETAEHLASLSGDRVGGDMIFSELAPGDIAVSSAVVPQATDLRSDGLTFSNPHPLRGETITISAGVRNAGLKATSARSPFTVKFYDGNLEDGALIGERRVEGPLMFNTAAAVSIPYTVGQGKLRSITAVVDSENSIAESNEVNNTARAVLGQVPQPVRLFANPEPEPGVISLGWASPDTDGIARYLVFRSTSPGTDYELVGTTNATDFIDTLVTPGMVYYYVVSAVDVYGICSPFSNQERSELVIRR